MNCTLGLISFLSMFFSLLSAMQGEAPTYFYLVPADIQSMVIPYLAGGVDSLEEYPNALRKLHSVSPDAWKEIEQLHPITNSIICYSYKDILFPFQDTQRLKEAGDLELNLYWPTTTYRRDKKTNEREFLSEKAVEFEELTVKTIALSKKLGVQLLLRHFHTDAIRNIASKAIDKSENELVKSLFNYCASKIGYNNYYFHKSVFENNLELVQYFIEKGNADINYISNPENETALIKSIRNAATSPKEALAIVEYLLEKDANPNICDGGHKKPLSIAKAMGNQEVVDLLEKYGARK